MAGAFKAPIVAALAVAPRHVELVIEHPELSMAAPGQFAHILTPGMLRRPVSFSRIDPQRGRAGLLVQVVGQGTAWLAERSPGEWLDVLAPLGRGFQAPDPARPWILVGGGVGIPPLYSAWERWGPQHRAPACAILGAREADGILMAGDFQGAGLLPVLATEDGSAGRRGTVVGPLEEWLARYPEAQVMACGPNGMLAQVSRVAAGATGPVQLAMEQRMGCGIGACLACVVPATPVGPEGPRYRRVCTDGPVFFREELAWSWI
ncbi:MAG: dihydroorotate dehydrogenase electron transfer subunit [Firmicutes bacterium]|nr:dihydroorotate dehydrogenase electron transfer subunit [Bacillota bacterium]